MRLDSIGIKPRLIGAFVMVALIAGLVGWRGMAGMSMAKIGQDKIATQQLPSIDDLRAIQADANMIRLQERTLINPEVDSATRVESSGRLAAAWSDLGSAQKRYESIPHDGDEVAAYKKCASALEVWKAAHSQVTAMLDSGNRAAAGKLSFTVARKAFAPFKTALEDAIKTHEKYAEASDATFDRTYQSTFNTVIIFVVIGVLAAVAFGYFISTNVSKQVATLGSASDKLALGNVATTIDTNSKDEIGQLAKSMQAMAANIQSCAKAAEQVAAGNLEVEIQAASEDDILANSMIKVVDTLRGLVAEAQMLRAAAVEGRLETRGNAAQFDGGYRDIVAGFNDTLDAVIGPLNVAAEYVDRVSSGEIPEKITDEYSGDFNEIKNNLNKCIDAVNELAVDANMLSDAAIAGRLETRADASKHQGDFAKIISGVNATLDTVVDKVFWYEALLDSVPFPLSVTDKDMNWTFINKAVEDFLGLKRADVVGKQCSNWNANICKTDQCGIARLRAGETQTLFEQMGMKFQVDTSYILNAQGEQVGHIEVVQDITAANAVAAYQSSEVERLAGNLQRLAAGDLDLDTSVADADQYTGATREGFVKINDNLKQAKDAVSALIEDAGYLAQSAVDGDLNARADASRHQGDFQRIVQGVNDTLNAVVGPLNVAAHYVERLAGGDIPEPITDEYRGDFNQIKENLNSLVDTFNSFVRAQQKMAEMHDAGEIDDVIPHAEFPGIYGQMARSINELVWSHIAVSLRVVEVVSQYGEGDFSTDMDKLPGKKAMLTEAVDNVKISLQTLNEEIKALAQAAVRGDLSARGDAEKFRYEFREMVMGINNTLDAVIGPVNEAATVLERLAANDLTARVVGDYQGDHAKIKDSVNTAMETLQDAMTQVADAADKVSASAQSLSSTSEEVGKASQQVAETMGQVASGSQEQSRVVQSSASAMEQLTRAIQEIAAGAQSQARTVEGTVSLVEQSAAAISEVAKLSQDATANGRQVAEIASAGGQQVEDAVGSMSKIKQATDQVAGMVRQLGQSSQQIGAIVETIDDIAEQTNLLALNAAIEAARAGEHGKGFAVVADEVRKLAERSSKATGEIAELITSIQNMTTSAVEAMDRGSREVEEGAELGNQAGQALSQIQDAVSGIVVQIENMSAAAEQMAAASTEVIKAVENVSAITEETTAAAEEMSASSTEVVQQIEQVAAVSEENAAAAEEVSATTEEQNAAVEEMTAASEELARMAGQLQELVSCFKTGEADSTMQVVPGSTTRDLRKAA